jgi:hypothetical protein
MKEFLQYYDPNANWRAYLRVGWMMWDEVLRQQVTAPPAKPGASR